MGKRRTNMRAMRAEQFSGYEALKLVELPRPVVSDGRVFVRITAAGVTPLDHTTLSGNFHTTKVPLVLGNEGAGVVEEGGGTDFPAGSHVMFSGAYGAFEDGAYSEWIAVDSPLEPQPAPSLLQDSSSRVRIETRWRATKSKATTTAKAL
jgi:NADPH:quinone reductase-like Zn-dependent oxidoreductase